MSGGLVVLGSQTLAGRELVERLRAAGLGEGLELVGVDEELATLTSIGGELRVETPDLRAVLADARAVLVAEVPSEEQLDRLLAAAERVPVLDLTGALEGRPLDDRRGDLVSPGACASPTASALLIGALVRAADAAGATPPAVAVALEPASELGLEAVDEFHGQAVALLNFQELPTAIFGSQAVHDLRSPGREGAARERRLRHELAGLSASPIAALRVQSGAFHGAVVAVRCGLAAAAWREALAEVPELELSDEPGEASAVKVSSAGRAVVSRVEDDGTGGAWAWAAADSLEHGGVGNAVRLLVRDSSGA